MNERGASATIERRQSRFLRQILPGSETTGMAHTPDQILNLLPLLADQRADDLESDTLDFKECATEEKIRELSREMAICLGNAQGGTVVFGVKEKVIGVDRAVAGIDFAPDLDALKAHLCGAIAPKLPVQFEWLDFGSRRLLLMHVHSSMPPYTTTSGKARSRWPDCSWSAGKRPSALTLTAKGPLSAERQSRTWGSRVSSVLSWKRGQEAPVFEEIGQMVRVAFPDQQVDQAFKALLSFLTEKQGAYLDVDDLFLLRFFRRRHEAHWAELREAYRYDDRRLRERRAALATNLLMIEHSGRVYRLSRRAAAILNQATTYDMTRGLGRGAIKVRILTLLEDRPLRTDEIRAYTDLDRQQTYRILRELAAEEFGDHPPARGPTVRRHDGLIVPA